MNIVTYQTDIPLKDSYDVIVLGGGPAGCTAAASAAREGAKTLLIEASGVLGGMGTGGLVPCWCPLTDKEKIIYRGMAQTVITRMKAEMPHVPEEKWDWLPIDAEVLKRVYDRFVKEYGVDVLFGTHICQVQAENGCVSSVIASNKQGLCAYRAKVYVDCTGDADVAALAGAAFMHGDKNGNLMPATLCFTVANIDEEAYRRRGGIHGQKQNSPIHAVVTDNAFPLVTDSHLCPHMIGNGVLGLNSGHLCQVDSTDPQSVSDALMKGREMAHQIHEGLKKYCPEVFAQSIMVATAPMMGIREGRRILGDYTLTIDDYISRRTFDDEICRNSYYVDVHMSPEQQASCGANLQRRYEPGESHGVPYRCMVPQNLINVLVAGRSVSCDREIQGSVRVMPNCLCTGEAAGMAAAMAAKTDSDVHAVDVKKLRERLKEEGVYFL
ncbi:MAG: FAD-dependent oxidoreductase [Oscillospiraceae bacterium]|nr:FAD-dependent oxidoreductase [Oscillospiraceae bacterium]